jgi:uncharacterized protein YaaN involved in tellurite resistance
MIQNPVKSYFDKYETGQGAINSIIKSLHGGKATLENDNRILSSDKKASLGKALRIGQEVTFLRAIDDKLTGKVAEVTDDDHRKFLEEEVLFSLRQKIQDLSQSQLVSQQGVITMEMLIRNNKELIRGVRRALDTTVEALEIAVTLALALVNQEIVLEAVGALNETTNELIARTAKRLKTQGVEIQKQASSAMLDPEVLKQAFADVTAALDDISTYRQKALPVLAKNIIDFNNQALKAEKVIEQMEKGDMVLDGVDNMFQLEVAA